MSGNRTSGLENRMKKPPGIESSGFRTSGSQLTVRISNARIRFGHSKSGRFSPVIGRSGNWRRLKSGHNVRLSDVIYKPDVRNPDITSGFRTFGQLYLQTGSKPVLVPIRTKTGTKPGSKPVWNRFWLIWNRTFEIQTL